MPGQGLEFCSKGTLWPSEGHFHEQDKASRGKQSREKTPPEMPGLLQQCGGFWKCLVDEAGCHSEVIALLCGCGTGCSPTSRLRSAGRGLSQLGEVGGSGGQSSTHDPSGHRLDLPQQGTLHPSGAGFLCIVSVIEAQKPFV